MNRARLLTWVFRALKIQYVSVFFCVIFLLLVAIDLRDSPAGVSIVKRLGIDYAPEALISFDGTAVYGIPPPPHTHTGRRDVEFCVVAGVIRNDRTGWRVIDDGGHTPVNIRRVHANLHSIVVEYAFKAETVHSFLVTPDEALARNGVFVGASVGRERAQILLSRAGFAGTHQISPLTVTTEKYPWSNLWIYGLFSGKCRS